MKYCVLLFITIAALQTNAQVVSDSFVIDGHTRSFHYNKPRDSRNASLMFIMHGSGGNAKNMMKNTTRLEAIAATENLIIVYPDGYKNYWNECRKFATSEANKLDINEQAFFSKMIAYFVDRYHVDNKKVFAAGFSGGGHMTYKLGLTMPGTIRAIAAIVANMPDDGSIDCIPSGKPVPVMIINGTNDRTNPWEGGEMFVHNSSYGKVKSSENTFAYWSNLAGYTSQPVQQLLPDTDPADNKRVQTFTHKAPGKPEVQLVKVIGGGHDYPRDIDVYEYAWKFFKSQLTNDVSKADNTKQTSTVEAACGMCQFGMKGEDCALAVRIDGKPYYVSGTDIDAHGDAHAADGFCNSIRNASVQGTLEKNIYHVTYFKLQP